MNDNITVALISSGGTFLTAIAALTVNMRAFASLDRRIERLDQDNKEFFKWFGRLEADIGRIKDHIDLKS